MTTEFIYYRVFPRSPTAHLFEVSLQIAHPQPAGQELRLPSWIPGSYMLREFARHLVQIQAECEGVPVAIEKLDKAAWRCAPVQGALLIRYQVYAFDLSVRAAYLDQKRGFFNGSSLFLSAEGFEHTPCRLDIVPPEGAAYQRWRLATSLTPVDAQLYGFGRYAAENYADLIDHPVEMSDFSVARFTVAGVPHDLVLIGQQQADRARLCADLQRICSAQVALFGELPLNYYVFLVIVTGQGYGGLEHRASCTLQCERKDLPKPGQSAAFAQGGQRKGYQRFLGLCSHEYFHLWNVKRIKPAAFLPYDLSRETYTRQLWAFEGITSYYDDLHLLRSGCISAEEYLSLLAQTITRVWRMPGRLLQSVADSSFDTWIKLYHPNENTPNAQVSYYNKGALLALALDLRIRRDTQGAKSLDTVLQAAWQQYGQTGIGVPEGGIERLVESVSGLDFSDFFQRYLYGTEDVPLAELLAAVGVCCCFYPADVAPHTEDGGFLPAATTPSAALLQKPSLGIKLDAEQEVDAVLKHVFSGGAAQEAGLAGADRLVALDWIRVNKQNFSKLLDSYLPGDQITVHAFRRDELMQFNLTLQAVPADTCYLSWDATADHRTLQARACWLQQQQLQEQPE